MSRIDDLIAEHCPDGVEYRALGEVGDTFGGLTGKTKGDFSDGNHRFVSYVNVHSNPAVDLLADDYVRIGEGERQRELRKGDVLLTGSSETADEVAISSVLMDEPSGPLYLNSFTIGVRFQDPTLLLPGFSKHLFRSRPMRRQLARTANGVTRFNVSKARLAKVVVPVPPLEVQGEIVRILDAFSKLEAELEAELEARQQQYTHYRDTLLNFSEDVPRVPMSEVGEVFRGRRFLKSDYVADGIPSMHYGELYTTYGVSATLPETHLRSDLESVLRFAEPGDVVIAEVGETVEDVGTGTAWLGGSPIAIHDGCFGFRSDLNPVYVAHYLRSAAFQSEKRKYVARGKVKRLSIRGVRDIRIPVPTRSTQDRIVDVFDKFDALVNDLSAGLPAELAARRKQYEYYRDKLLTFDELAPRS